MLKIKDYDYDANDVIPFEKTFDVRKTLIGRIFSVVAVVKAGNSGEDVIHFRNSDIRIIIRELVINGVFNTYNDMAKEVSEIQAMSPMRINTPKIFMEIDKGDNNESDKLADSFAERIARRYTKDGDGVVSTKSFVVSASFVKSIIEKVMGPQPPMDVFIRSHTENINKQVDKKPVNKNFFSSLAENFPDYYTAFSNIGIEHDEACKLIKKKKYINIFKEVDKMVKLKNMATLYRNAKMGDTAAIKVLLKDVEEDGTKKGVRKQEEVAKKEVDNAIPEYLKNPDVVFEPTESEMERIDRNLTED